MVAIKDRVLDAKFSGPPWLQLECVLDAKFSGPPWLQLERVSDANFSRPPWLQLERVLDAKFSGPFFKCNHSGPENVAPKRQSNCSQCGPGRHGAI